MTGERPTLALPGRNFQRNLHISDEVQAVAAEAGATPAQVALAWLLAKGDDIVPIPGTKRAMRVEENIVGDHVALTESRMARLDKLPVAAGDDHDAEQMRILER